MSENIANDGIITLDEAKIIAASEAGFLPEDVTFTKVYVEYKDGCKKIKVEFSQSGTEYEYVIDATTGEVLDINVDPVFYD